VAVSAIDIRSPASTPVLRASPALRSTAQIFSADVQLLNAHRCQVMATSGKKSSGFSDNPN
jgi:hypothetical protein